MKLFALILLFIFTSIIISGCATVLSGYDAEIQIHKAPNNLRVYTTDGIELSSPYYKTPK
jgi:hypothetical protein